MCPHRFGLVLCWIFCPEALFQHRFTDRKTWYQSLVLDGQEIRGRKEPRIYNGRTFRVRDIYRWSVVKATFYSTLSWTPDLLDKCFCLGILQPDAAWLKLPRI